MSTFASCMSSWYHCLDSIQLTPAGLIFTLLVDGEDAGMTL